MECPKDLLYMVNILVKLSFRVYAVSLNTKKAEN